MKVEPPEELKMLYRICFWRSEGFHLIRVLSCILLLAMCGPCATRNHLVSCADGMRSSLDYDACQSYTDNDASLPDLLFSIGDISSDHGRKSSARCFDLKHVCANTNFFCFPSTLSVFLSEDGEQAIFKVPEYSDDSRSVSVPHDIGESNSSWFAAHATYKLLNGRMVSCSLNPVGEIRDQLPPQHSKVDQTTCKGPLLPTSIPDKNSKVAESDILDGSSSPHVAISPPLLDWGQNNLYAPSLAFLTVTNTCNDSILHVYEPFSTNPQFYSYDFEEMSLAPGESASLSFVFLPRWLGSSSAHLVLQTSLGGFLIHAKGRASGSPYGIQPLVGLDILSDGRLTKSFSLYNPFDSALFVVELTAWIAISSANTSDTAQAVCTIDELGATDEFTSILDDKEWLNVKGSGLGFPMMGIRPFGHWQVDPHGTEPIMEMKLLPHVEGKVFGALCMQLQSSSMDRTDTVIVPLEAETHRRVAYTSLTGSVSVFFDSVKACDEKGSIAAALSLRNGASHILSVVKISELTESKKLFQVKYMEGLVLFPGTITHIAVIIYTPHDDSQDSRPELPSISSDCKLLIMTNDSFSPQIEIPCLDIVLSYLGHNSGSASASAPETSYIGLEFQREDENTENSKTGSLGSNIQVSPSVKWQVSEIAEVDELILRNWKSHGSTSGMSILEEDIVLFPTVRVRTHSSRWISVSNPSGKPVVMQLVLNAGAIVDQCRDADESLEHTLLTSFVRNDSMVARDGFSIDETAVTEAYVPPFGKALLGPIIFSPSNRCVWRSSALIRNNLSGVEWLHLQGFGGSISLLLLEGSEPIRNLEFNFDLPIPINVSSPELSFHMEATKAACSRPLSKVIYAKNVGDIPLEVRKIEVSGTDCGSDGFMIHTCKGFALEPGESTRLLISYQTDFSASVVHRDLELALAAGILVVPMKASLPVYMLSLCRKSFFWTLLRKLSVIVLFAASVTFLLFYRIIPQSVASFGQDYLFKTEKNPIATISRADKLLRPHRNQKNTRLLKEAENSEIGFVPCYSNSPNSVKEVGITAQPVQHKQNNQDQVIDRLHLQMKTCVSQSPMEKSVAEIEGSTTLETPPPTANLTVRTQKEKRRRKRRAAGTCYGITGKFEVSSSQSGNSTPSSPISPVASSTPKRLWPLSPDVDHSVRAPEHLLTIAQNQRCEKEQAFKAAIEAKLQEPDTNIESSNDSWLLSVNEQPFIPKEKVSKPVLLPSATFPGPGWRAPGSVGNSPFLSSPSVIAPHARAPGSKVSKEEPMKIKEKVRPREEFTYDIWGNHFSGLHLTGRQNDSPKASDVFEGESQSFFARGPVSHTEVT